MVPGRRHFWIRQYQVESQRLLGRGLYPYGLNTFISCIRAHDQGDCCKGRGRCLTQEEEPQSTRHDGYCHYGRSQPKNPTVLTKETWQKRSAHVAPLACMSRDISPERMGKTQTLLPFRSNQEMQFKPGTLFIRKGASDVFIDEFFFYDEDFLKQVIIPKEFVLDLFLLAVGEFPQQIKPDPILVLVLNHTSKLFGSGGPPLDMRKSRKPFQLAGCCSRHSRTHRCNVRRIRCAL